jgi:hypothetical protein
VSIHAGSLLDARRARGDDGAMNRKLLPTLLAGVLAAAAPAAADAATYKGKTKSGTKISFRTSGGSISKLRTLVPTVCISTRSRATKAGAEPFWPTAGLRFKVGRTVKKSASQQPSAMAPGRKVTKYYTVTSKKAGRRITGKLKLSFSWFVPDLFGYWTSYICSGSTSFTARS